MARYSDEQYEFMQDTREKKTTAHSARNRRGHCGKGGAVKLPSDFMTKKERDAMNGECKSYRMNDPMTWEQFKEIPDDLKGCYIKALRLKYDVPDSYIAEMMGASKSSFSAELTRLGLKTDAGRGKRSWDKEGFTNWCNGVRVRATKPTPVVVEVTEEETEISTGPVEAEYISTYSPDCNSRKWVCDHPETTISQANERPLVSIPVEVPKSGTLVFEGDARDIMNTLGDILQNRRVKLNVQWTVVDKSNTNITMSFDNASLAEAAKIVNYSILNEQRKKKHHTLG